MGREPKARGKKRRALNGKGKKLLVEVAKTGRARPMIINVSPDTAKKLRKLLCQTDKDSDTLTAFLALPPKFRGEEKEDEVPEDQLLQHWEPCWLEVIYEMASRFATEEEILAFLPYTYSMWVKLKHRPETRIKDVLQAGRSDGMLFLKSKFRSRVEEGDTRAIIFGLRAQAGWREDGLGSEGPDRGQNSGALSGAVDRILAAVEAKRD